MIVDAFSNVISLNIPPEDYELEYSFEFGESQETFFKISSLLTFRQSLEIPAQPRFFSSVPDFIFNMSKLGISFKLTDKAMEVCKGYIQQVHDLEGIKKGTLNHKVNTNLKNTPYFDQKSAIAFMLARKKALNSSSVGIGKTITALGCFNILKNENKIDAGIIFVLNENKLSWYDEILKHTGYEYTVIRNGSEKVIEDIESFKGDLLVVHYDALLNPDVCLAIIAHHFDFWIVDEAHTLRNADKTIKVSKKGKKQKETKDSSQRTSALYQLRDTTDPTFIFALTGTPVSQSPMNAYGILKLLKPNFVPDRTKFEDHFCNFIKIPYKKGAKFKIKILNKAKPYKNLDELKALLTLVSYRQTHDDLGDDFPKMQYIPKTLAMEPDQRVVYEQIKNETFKQIASDPEKALNLDKVLIKTLRLRQCLSNPALVGEKHVSSIKFKFLDQLLEEMLEDPLAKVVVFSPNRPTLDLLTEKYKTKYRAGLFAGVDEKLSAEERDLNVHNFTQGDSQLLFSNTSKAVGQNWGMAIAAIFLDLPLVAIDFTQSCGRIRRRDSKGSRSIILLLIENSYDEWSWKRLDEMRKHAGEIISQDSEIVLVDKEELLKVLK